VPGAAPVEVVLRARKPRFAAGESVLLDLAQAVRADAVLETVEMNRDRTTVRVFRLDGPGGEETLTGVDHADLHRVELHTRIGRTMRLPAGTMFDTFVDLPQFRLPLPAGRYRIDLTYRWGGTDDEVLRTNAADVEVAPAAPVSATDRWLAAADPRDELATLYTATLDGAAHWMYRAAAGFDPSVVRMACDLGEARPGASCPRVAHLNDIAAMHFERWIVWIEGESIGFQQVSARGPLADPVLVPHGLGAGAFLADPPLHRRDRGLTAVVVGADASGAAAALVVDVPVEGPPSSRTVSLAGAPPRHAIVVWDDESEDRPLGASLHLAQAPDAAGVSRVVRTDLAGSVATPFAETDGAVLALVADQWLGDGVVFVLVRDHDRFVTLRRNLGDAVQTAEPDDETPFSLVADDGAAADPIDVVCLGDGTGLVTLFRGAAGWIVVTPSARFDLAFAAAPAPGTPRLVATRRDGVFLVFGDAAHGFVRACVVPGATPS
jgi:hypothetical protein